MKYRFKIHQKQANESSMAAESQAVAATTTAAASSGGDRPSLSSSIEKKKNNEQEQGSSNKDNKIDYNPRWNGYLLITLFSFVNFTSIAIVPTKLREKMWFFSMMYGSVTFVIVLCVLLQDRILQHCTDTKWIFVPSWLTAKENQFMKLRDGYAEGYTLVLLVVIWIIGVFHITRPAGIAYQTNNIYYSSWFALFSCVYTLNEWSSGGGTGGAGLSIEEIVGVSLTLRYWWIHFFGGIVVFISSVALSAQLNRVRRFMKANSFSINPSHERDAFFGIFMGIISIVVSSFFILTHYNFITDDTAEEGGWLELFIGLLELFVWIIAICILTPVNGIAATTNGYDCMRELINNDAGLEDNILDANIVVLNCTTIHNGVAQPCALERFMPGSNMFFACWTCALSIIMVVLKWKQAKAIAFAQAQQQQQQRAGEGAVTASADGDNDNEDDDDIYNNDDDDDDYDN